MKVSRLTGEIATAVITVPATVEGPEEKVTVKYRPGALTLEVADQLREIGKSEFQVDAVMYLLKPMLVEWDLEDDEGRQLPVDEATLKTIPLAFLGQLVEKITADNRVSEVEAKTLGAGSPQEDELEQRRTGSLSSAQHSSGE